MIYANSGIPLKTVRVTFRNGQRLWKLQNHSLWCTYLWHEKVCLSSLMLLILSIPPCYPLSTLQPPKTTHLLRPVSTTLQKGNSALLPSPEVEKWEDIIKERRRKEASTNCCSTICLAQRQALYKYTVFQSYDDLMEWALSPLFYNHKMTSPWDAGAGNAASYHFWSLLFAGGFSSGLVLCR